MSNQYQPLVLSLSHHEPLSTTKIATPKVCHHTRHIPIIAQEQVVEGGATHQEVAVRHPGDVVGSVLGGEQPASVINN